MKKIILGGVLLLMSLCVMGLQRKKYGYVDPQFHVLDFPVSASYDKAGYECWAPAKHYVWEKDGLYVTQFSCDWDRARSKRNLGFMHHAQDVYVMDPVVVIPNKYIRHKNDLNFKNDRTIYFRLHLND